MKINVERTVYEGVGFIRLMRGTNVGTLRMR